MDSRLHAIDTHTHFYDPSRPGGVPWPSPQDIQLYRTTLPHDFEAVAGDFLRQVLGRSSPLLQTLLSTTFGQNPDADCLQALRSSPSHDWRNQQHSARQNDFGSQVR